MIKLTLKEEDFINLMHNGWGFSEDGRRALFKYLNGLDDEIEFDIPKICGNWVEYQNIETANMSCKSGKIEDETIVLKCANGCVVVKEQNHKEQNYKLLRMLDTQTEYFVVEEGCVDTCRDFQQDDQIDYEEYNPQYKIVACD